jgi:trimeric autotransporter adhesin
MKKQFLLATTILFVGGSVLLTSCKKDEEAPMITINGGTAKTIVLNAALTDPGATASDNEDGDLSSSVTSDYLTTVNKDKTGTYTVTYKVSDEAGNEGTATLSVSVKNDAESLAGSYTVTDVVGGDTYTYPQTVTASETVNNRITFNKFGNYVGNTGIYANVTGNTVDLPSQTATGVGSPAANRVFSGTGQKNTSGFVVNYNETTNGISSNGVMTFVK